MKETEVLWIVMVVAIRDIHKVVLDLRNRGGWREAMVVSFVVGVFSGSFLDTIGFTMVAAARSAQ